MAKFQFMDLADLQLFKSKLDEQTKSTIDSAVSTALRAVSISSDGYTIYFYRTATPLSTQEAVFSIPLPEPIDISGKVDKVSSATAEHLASLTSDGNIADSGKLVSDFATKEQGKIAEQAKSLADQNAEEIIKINDATTGILKTAKNYTDSKINALRIGDYATLAYVDEQLSKVYTKTEMDATIKGVETTISDLTAYVGTIPATAVSKDIVHYISEVANNISENGYDDSELRDRVTEVEGKVDVLNGEGIGSVKKQVADAVSSIISGAPEAYDTLKEISDWISSHSDSAAAMNSQIQTNKTDITNLKRLIGELPEDAGENATVIQYLMDYADSLYEAIDLDLYAKQADLDNTNARVSANETAITAIQTSLATGGTIANAIKTALDTAKNAQKDVDELESFVGTLPEESSSSTVVEFVQEETNKNKSEVESLKSRVSTAESNITTVTTTANANKAAITAINDPVTGLKKVLSDDATSKANAALSTAKEYTDALKNTEVAQNAASILSNAGRIESLEAKVGDGFEAIKTADILLLFEE